jgi:hypothetical protein
MLQWQGNVESATKLREFLPKHLKILLHALALPSMDLTARNSYQYLNK